MAPNRPPNIVVSAASPRSSATCSLYSRTRASANRKSASKRSRWKSSRTSGLPIRWVSQVPMIDTTSAIQNGKPGTEMLVPGMVKSAGIVHRMMENETSEDAVDSTLIE